MDYCSPDNTLFTASLTQRTPDGHPFLGRHPSISNVVLGAGFSGECLLTRPLVCIECKFAACALHCELKHCMAKAVQYNSTVPIFSHIHHFSKTPGSCSRQLYAGVCVMQRCDMPKIIKLNGF